MRSITRYARSRLGFLTLSDSLQLVEHLRAYFTTWQSNMNIKNTLAQTSSTRKATDLAVRHPKRSDGAPPAPERSKPAQVACGGILGLEDMEVSVHIRRLLESVMHAQTTAPN